jgi:hypothetical protein
MLLLQLQARFQQGKLKNAAPVKRRKYEAVVEEVRAYWLMGVYHACPG